MTTRNEQAFLALEGNLTISQATELKKALESSLAKAKTVEVNLKEVTEIDLACLQLLCSAHLTATRQDKAFTITNAEASAVAKARENAGLLYNKPCSLVDTDDCLWLGGSE